MVPLRTLALLAFTVVAVLGSRVARQSEDGEHYVVTTIVQEPFLMMGENKTIEGGYMYELMNKLADMLDFTYEFRLVNDNRYGSEDDEGNWNGMIGELISGEADIAAASLTVTYMRELVISFTKPFMSSGITAISKKPELQTQKDLYLLFKPFTCEVWILIVVAYILFCLGLFLLNLFHPHEHKAAFSKGKSSETDATAFGIQGAFWTGLTTFALQGISHRPRSFASRVLVAFWFVFVLFTVFLYIASLTAIVSKPMGRPRHLQHKSVDDLAKDPDMKLGFVSGGSTEAFFKASTVAVYEKVYTRAKSVPTNTDGINMVREHDGRYTFFIESPTSDYLTQRKPCDLESLDFQLNSVGYALAVGQDKDELREQLSGGILQLRETGFLQKLQKKFWNDMGECGVPHLLDSGYSAEEPTDYARPLTVGRFAGAFIIFLVGVLLTVIVAVVEIFVIKFRKQPRKQKEQLVEAEEGQALNETAQTALNETAAAEPEDKKAEEDKKSDDVGPELEPEDKEKKEDVGTDKKEKDDGDKIEPIEDPKA